MNHSGKTESVSFLTDSVLPVQISNISKRFGATQALYKVDLELRRGEVHGFAGENGAGKSTLGKIISGLYSKDEGSLRIHGEVVERWDTKRAQRRGIVLIAQELSLVPELSVANNVFLGVEAQRAGVLVDDTHSRFESLDTLCGFGLDPKKKIKNLPIADQQKVEIMRALARDARVIIMDEPTSSLTSDEVEKLHRVIRRLSKQGRTVVYITHFLDALLETTDRITVLRDGKIVKTSPTVGETKLSLVESMLGRSLSATFPDRKKLKSSQDTPRIELVNLSSNSGIHGVSLHINPGEIVGLAGLVGSGRTEIARAIFGVDEITAGEIRFDGKVLTEMTPRKAIRQGIVMVPESRREQGLMMVRSVRENISLPHLDLFSSLARLQLGKERTRIEELVAQVGVTPPRINSTVADFSGGNQQKVLFAKWLLNDPRFIILDEPTRGVDIGAKVKIYELIAKLAARGTAVMLISSEHEEVLALSHRMYLIKDLTVTGELDPTSSTVADVLFGLFGLKKESNADEERVNE